MASRWRGRYLLCCIRCRREHRTDYLRELREWLADHCPACGFNRMGELACWNCRFSYRCSPASVPLALKHWAKAWPIGNPHPAALAAD